MSLDPNNHQNAVSAAANALQAVGIAQTNNQQQQQQQQAAQQYAQHQLNQNQFYQQHVQQAHHRANQAASQHQQLLNAATQLQQAQQAQQAQQQYQSAQQQLAQHLPQATASATQTNQGNNNANTNSLGGPVIGQGFQPTQPQSEFTSRQDLISYIHAYARENGFGIVISHSNEKAIYFTCELGGSYRNKRNINDKERKRKLTTRKISCPFTMVANCKKNDNDEVVKWVLRITNADHNHDKMNLNESFPMLRRRNPEINRQIRELYMKGNKPLVIEKLLKSTFKDILINREDIYNETRKMKREERLKSAQGISTQNSIPQQHQQSPSHHHSQQHTPQQQSQQSLKAADEAFDQNIPNLLQSQGIPLGLANQYVAQNLQQSPTQQQQHQQNQNNNQFNPHNYNLHQQAAAAAAINAVQNVGNLQQGPKEETNLSNIDINLVKQQGL